MLNTLHQMLPLYIEILTKYNNNAKPRFSSLYGLFFRGESELCDKKHALAMRLLRILQEYKVKIEKETESVSSSDSTPESENTDSDAKTDTEIENDVALSPNTPTIIKKVSVSSESSVPNRANNSNDYMERSIAAMHIEKIRHEKRLAELEAEHQQNFYNLTLNELLNIFKGAREECVVIRGDHNKGNLDDLLELIYLNIRLTDECEQRVYGSVFVFQEFQKQQPGFISDPILDQFRYTLMNRIQTYLCQLEFDLKLHACKNITPEKKNLYKLKTGISMLDKTEQGVDTARLLNDIWPKIYDQPKRKRKFLDSQLLVKMQYVKLYGEYSLTEEQLATMHDINPAFVAALQDDMKNLLEAYKMKYNDTEAEFLKLVEDFKKHRAKPFVLETATAESIAGYSSEDSGTPRTPFVYAKF